MPEQNAVVAVYGTHIKAEEAAKEPKRAGIDMRPLRLVGKDTHTDEHAVGYLQYLRSDEALGKDRRLFGRLLGSLYGSAFFAIPGIGPRLTKPREYLARRGGVG